jgi:hypothetical protein
VALAVALTEFQKRVDALAVALTEFQKRVDALEKGWKLEPTVAVEKFAAAARGVVYHVGALRTEKSAETGMNNKVRNSLLILPSL